MSFVTYPAIRTSICSKYKHFAAKFARTLIWCTFNGCCNWRNLHKVTDIRKSHQGFSRILNREPCVAQALPEPQWLNCDVRSFDMSVLGKFGVIMTDPPWEIHQDLPYGTMADNEMRKLDMGCLQDDGVIFVWVTGA